MKILSITAQKPNSTGSGVYLTEVVKGFANLGHEQAVIGGVYEEDPVEFPEGVEFYPVYFHTEALPFAIPGMSDEMPYESTVYGQMTDTMVLQFQEAYEKKLKQVLESFQPDIIICHHLYLLTAIVREVVKTGKVFGFCHNTDLRQMCKIPLKRDYIRSQIQKLDGIFALHEEQKAEIMGIYEIPEEKITVAGTGYNSQIFYPVEYPKTNTTQFIFAGKLSEKKGVFSLLRSFEKVAKKIGNTKLLLAGGYGNEEEYQAIRTLAENMTAKVEFLGKLSQTELARKYNESDIFVLPSFYEGMPLTVIEAMACNDQVIVTDLPGIKPWVEKKVSHAPIYFVEPPTMKHTDEPLEEALEAFEERLAHCMVEASKSQISVTPDLAKISWESVCRLVLSEAEKA